MNHWLGSCADWTKPGPAIGSGLSVGSLPLPDWRKSPVAPEPGGLRSRFHSVRASLA